jgi:protein-S-isoprenylcysteine O-methyltransferase Ste14
MSWSRVARRIRVPLGFAFAAVYIVLARPAAAALVAGLAVATSGLLVRAIASGQLRKNEELATGGIYSYTRNPLYLGSILIAAGFAIAARSVWVWIAILVLFVLIYVPTIRSEEAYLRENFPDFNAYCARVPRLVPRWSGESLRGGFSRQLYRKHREYNALIGATLMALALLLKMLLLHRSASH